MLVREHPGNVEELLATGATLRAAQAAVLAGLADGAELRTLAATRREQVDALVATAADLADRASRKSAPLDAVDATLVAATSDEAAAAAVRSGRLVKELSYSGFGMSDDLADSVAPALHVVPKAVPRKRSESRQPAAKPVARPAAAATQAPGADRRAAAEAAAVSAVQTAQQSVHAALGAADDAQRAFDLLARELERTEADARRLAGELAAAQLLLAATHERHCAAQGAAKSAHAQAERARAALIKAQRQLDRLR